MVIVYNNSFSCLVGIAIFLLTTTKRIGNVNGQSVVPRGIVSITRKIETNDDWINSIFDNGEEEKNQYNDQCNFTGTIVMGGPFSLEQEDKFFAVGSRQRVSYQLIVDYVNRFRCGVSLGPILGNYSIELRSYDDQSSTDWTTVIGNKLVRPSENVDILLGGYSSTLTKPLSDIANTNNKLLLAPGAASTSVFAEKDKVFGTFPPTAKYLAAAIEGLAGVGATSISTVYEDASFTKGVCGATLDLSNRFGLNVSSEHPVISTPNITTLEPVAQLLSKENPDVVITCVYDCVPWMKAMRNSNWSPKAQVFTVCVGLEDFSKEVGTDSEYIFGVTPWDASLNIQDVVTGWSARDFANTFQKETSDADVTYHASSAASIISIAIQAIEATQTIENQTMLANYIASHSFRTMYGEISFDLNGQSLAPSLLIQYDENGTVQTVYPTDISSSKILYPMPSWNRRDCIRLSECETLGHICGDDGQCICDDPNHWHSVGSGSTARCSQVEQMNYIDNALLDITYVAYGIILLAAIIAFGWIIYYRNHILVKISQPMFLSLIVIGTVISSSSIIPMGAQTGYRNTTDNILFFDFACMAIPWLWGLGFSITFSALFAKVWRVKELYNAGNAMQRRQVKHTDVIFIMVVFVAIETCILLSFQLLSPHHWERYVIQEIDGYPIESTGQCHSDYGWWYFAALVGFNILSLFYALVLYWQVKDIPSDFSESNYIFLSVMFMFQVLVITVPVSVMVKDTTNVFFFIRFAAVFLQNVTVLSIIFIPKMIRVYKNKDNGITIQQQVVQSVFNNNNNNPSQFTYNQSPASIMPSSKPSNEDSFKDSFGILPELFDIDSSPLEYENDDDQEQEEVTTEKHNSICSHMSTDDVEEVSISINDDNFGNAIR